MEHLCVPPLEHSSDAEVLIEVGPVDAHRHELVVRTLGRRRALEPRIPIERRGDLAPIGERHDKLTGGELNRPRAQIADINFQSTHAKPSAVRRDLVSDGARYHQVRAREIRRLRQQQNHESRIWPPYCRNVREYGRVRLLRWNRRTRDKNPDGRHVELTVVPQYRFAIGSSSAGNSVITRQPLS